MQVRKKNTYQSLIQSDHKETDEFGENGVPLHHSVTTEIDNVPLIQPDEDPIDFRYLDSLAREVVKPIIENYFRAELIGAEKIPDRGPYILATNHSGNAFPHDAIILDGLIWISKGLRKDMKLRSVYAPKLSATWWMRPYGIDDWWRRCGGIDMKFRNYDYLMQHGGRVIYYPEGIPGIGKGFNRRYQLQHFYSSFVVMAAKHHAPVYPVYSINSEWVNPTSITFKWLDYLSDRFLNIPFLPMPAAIIALFFPFFFYLAFPANMKFVVGDPIDVRSRLTEMGTDPDHPDKNVIQQLADCIRRQMQGQLDHNLEIYGKKPYDYPGLKASFQKLGWRTFRYTPFGWPFLFIKHARDQHRGPAGNRFIKWLRDLDIWAYFIPLGWIIISLCRQLRKPPYGYRGLSKRERLKKEGKYLWMLDQQQL